MSLVTHVAALVAPANGLPVLREVFRSLQGSYPGALLLVIHSDGQPARQIADNLNVIPNFMVLPGLDGVVLRNGHAYVIQAGDGLVVGSDGSLMRAYDTDSEDAAASAATPPDRNPVDGLLSSLANRYGKNAIAVALTALSAEEREGFLAVRQAGGSTMALNEANRIWSDLKGIRVTPGKEDLLLSAEELGPAMLQRAAEREIPA